MASSDAEEKKIVKEYLENRNCSVNFISEKETETPDAHITLGDRQYIAEIKSPLLLFDHEAGVYKFVTTNSKLLTFIKKAVKQLNAIDPNHTLPWILIFTSNHFQLNWKNLTDALQGGVVFQRQAKPDFAGTDVYKRTKKYIKQLDGIVWLQANSEGKIHQMTTISAVTSDYEYDVMALLSELEKQKPNSMNMDNSFQLNQDGTISQREN